MKLAHEARLGTLGKTLSPRWAVPPKQCKGPPKISVTGRMAELVGGGLFPHSRGDMGGSGGPLRPIRLTENIMFFRLCA